MITWPPEYVCLSKDPDGPRYWRHRGGFVVGHKGYVSMVTVGSQRGTRGTLDYL